MQKMYRDGLTTQELEDGADLRSSLFTLRPTCRVDILIGVGTSIDSLCTYTYDYTQLQLPVSYLNKSQSKPYVTTLPCLMNALFIQQIFAI